MLRKAGNDRKIGFRGWILLLLFLVMFLPAYLSVGAQCAGFAKAVVKPELSPFVHDGNFNATILGEGERIVLRKTVFDDIKYRLVVKGVPELPQVRFKLIDDGGDILFDNADHDFTSKWDFDVQTTRSLSVEITVPEDDDESSDKGGCVAILFGIERE